MNAATPGQAPLQPVDSVYLYHWRFDRGEEFGLYRHAADAEAQAARRAGEGLSEVLSMAILGRPEQPAPELAEARDELATRLTKALSEAAACRSPVPDCRFCASNLSAVIALADAYAGAREATLRDGITELLADITRSANATRPSKKSAIEDEFAIALRKILEG